MRTAGNQNAPAPRSACLLVVVTIECNLDDAAFEPLASGDLIGLLQGQGIQRWLREPDAPAPPAPAPPSKRQKACARAARAEARALRVAEMLRPPRNEADAEADAGRFPQAGGVAGVAELRPYVELQPYIAEMFSANEARTRFRTKLDELVATWGWKIGEEDAANVDVWRSSRVLGTPYVCRRDALREAHCKQHDLDVADWQAVDSQE